MRGVQDEPHNPEIEEPLVIVSGDGAIVTVFSREEEPVDERDENLERKEDKVWTVSVTWSDPNSRTSRYLVNDEQKEKFINHYRQTNYAHIDGYEGEHGWFIYRVSEADNIAVKRGNHLNGNR